MFHRALDIDLPGHPPFAFTRYYSTSSSETGTMGWGWRHDWEVSPNRVRPRHSSGRSPRPRRTSTPSATNRGPGGRRGERPSQRGASLSQRHATRLLAATPIAMDSRGCSPSGSTVMATGHSATTMRPASSPDHGLGGPPRHARLRAGYLAEVDARHRESPGGSLRA
jgi:hypothetical protein